jgi:Arc/MetJ-type ribon-helix-helix transcriptional regulator
MNIALTDDLQQLLRNKVDNGQFPNEEAVVKEALKRFLVDEASERASVTNLSAELVEKRVPGPFIEDETALAVDLPRAGSEIACSYLPREVRQPSIFPGE